MATNRKSVNFLPDYLKSDKNSKFLAGTIDPLIQSPKLERIDGFVGSIITPNYNPTTDFYIKEESELRTNYSLEPALVFKDNSSNVTDVVAFDDIINEIGIQGGKIDNLNRLFRSNFYSYDPHIDWDKLVNYSQYHWLSTGPDSILFESDININDQIIGKPSYIMPNGYALSNGMKLKFSADILPESYRDKEFYVEGVGKGIKLVDIKLLDVNELSNVLYNETFDSDKFDTFPFDGDKKLPLLPEYVTINRASLDLNPWTRYNRWFHLEVIRITAEINNQPFLLSLDTRAVRPIIEFKPNIQLYNFGNKGIGNSSVIDTDTTDAFSSVDGTIGYYVDDVLLEDGTTVIFNADVDDNVRGKIYTVQYDTSEKPYILRLIETVTPNLLESIAINLGTSYQGTTWHYSSYINTDGETKKIWVKSQEHKKINQAPLFDLFDHDNISYTDKNSNFLGSKIFGYDIGTGTDDDILGFPLKYKNSVGVGSYLFKNYFMTDSIEVVTNGVSSLISTGVTYFKLFDILALTNVWNPSMDYQIPIIETQTILTATNTASILSIVPKFDTSEISVIASINSILTTATLSTSTLTLTFNKTLNVNDVLLLKITSDQIPNSNGHYDTPISLTNNPLNGNISTFTLSELSDHLYTMISRIKTFLGSFPGVSNLRDLDDYSIYGTRLIINANPIVFAKIFLGKKKHNVVDAIRHAGDQYNQFKMNLLTAMETVNSQLSPADALDKLLIDLNTDKELYSSYYRSDMLGYGSNKIKRTYTVSNSNNTHYPIGLDFNLTTLSFKSVLIYVNDIQLVNGIDYNFLIDEVIISKLLSVGDIIEIYYYPDTLGSFVPATPSKLGLYPAYPPYIYNDDSYLSSNVVVIQGHDGSIMQSYGDYRDNIILEYEKRIYNNIKVKYDSSIFNINDTIPGLFRERNYSASSITGPYFSPYITLPRKEGFFSQIAQFNADDSSQGPYNLGFEWNMFGTKFTQVFIGTNGYLTFGGGTDIYTPVQVGVLSYPAIYAEYTDLWQGYGPTGQLLSSGETPGIFYSTGTVGAFKYFRMRFQGSHYIQIYQTPTIPAYNYECTLYSNGVDQYVETIYENIPSTVRGLGPGDIGAVFGIANAGSVSSPGTGIVLSPQIVENNSSHVFYSTSNGGNWQYAGRGSFDAFKFQRKINVFKSTRYSLSEVNDILIKDFTKWAGIYNIDTTVNNVYNAVDPFTWNYTTGINTVTNTTVFGYWRGIYKYFYDTDRPDTHPWEILGHVSKPTWWDTYYSWTDTTKRSALILAITNGYIDKPPSTISKYTRPQFASIVPVNSLGKLLAPSEFLVNETGYYDKISDWKFGDHGPAETAWRRSSYWPFALNSAAALLYPCTYTSLMYDTSRTSLNTSTNQLTYLEDDLYLNPKKLLIEGYNNAQTAGFGVYVVEKGTQKDLNYLDILKQDLNYLNFNLFHKIGGFVSKDKLQVVIDSIDPLSQSPGAILPPENYNLLLNVSNPTKSASISGVVIQKLNNKFIIKGYDKLNPYFNIVLPVKSNSSGVLTVGGKSEQFTEWSGAITSTGLGSIDITSPTSVTTRYYKQGQIVRYNNRYYRVKVGHTTQSTFDVTLFYPLPELPMVGGATAQLSSRFNNTVIQVSYGSQYSTVQEIYDILIGYGAYLESQGFIFDEFNTDLNEIMDWKYTGKEFLYWTTQNWADGNLITLSPFADYLKYSYTNSVVDNISTGDYEYSLLKADGQSFPINNFRLSREDDSCIINTIDTLEGIFFATLNSVQKEHGMVIDNTTIFNDTIYDIETGYKQRRIKITGFRTAGWNGDLSSPGFVYDNVKTIDWAEYGAYLPGTVVRYNGTYYQSNVKILNDKTFDFTKWNKLNNKPESNLLPNFDYKINQFEDFYSLDIDNFDVAQQKLAQHLIGYTPRQYLNSIITDPISQYKFYQGFIKEKGTKNAIDKLSKVGKFTRQGQISFEEEWAFRVGNYGGFSTYNEIEFSLQEELALESTYLVKFVNSIPSNTTPLTNYKLPSDLLITPEDYISLSTFNTYPSTFSDTNFELTTAGYVRADDVTVTAYNKNSLLDIANNSLIQEGNTVWLGFLENGDWDVYRYTNLSPKIAGVYISSPGVDITFTTDINHNLSIGDIVSVVRFNEQVDGIHIITDIPRLDQFTVSSVLTTISNADLLSNGMLFKFEKARYTTVRDLINSNNLSKLNYDEKIWIDKGTNDKWQVYKKIENYNIGYINTASTTAFDQQFGYSIYSQENNKILLMAAPGQYTNTRYGNISVYFKIKNSLSKRFEFTLNSNNKGYCNNQLSNEFGYSLSYDTNKGLFFVGAPAASNVKPVSLTSGTVVLANSDSTPKPYINEGLVKISSYNNAITEEKTEAVLVNPYGTVSNIASHARFGHSIYTNNVDVNTSTTLLVGAPGDSVNTNTGKVYVYSVSRTNYYKATKAQVIYAYAKNILAEVYPSEATLLYWMVLGLETFNQQIINDRIANPALAASIDQTRAADSIGILETRGNVVAAFQNQTNPAAPIYPTENEIRYWMINGLGPDKSTFITAWIQIRNSFPDIATKIDSERTTVSTTATVSIVPHISGLNLYSPNILNFGSQFGDKIAGNSTGSVIAITAPYYSNTVTNITGMVQLFNVNATTSYINKIVSPFGTNDVFGNDIAVSSNGTYIIISSINVSNSNKSFGKVAVYKFNGSTATLHQIIDNPLPRSGMKFGVSISISDDNNTLAISALGTNNIETLTFDKTSKNGETVFDGGATSFISNIINSGVVYVYGNLNDYFVFAEKTSDPAAIAGNGFGYSVLATNNDIFVGSPSTTAISRLFEFYKIDKSVNGLKLLREQTDLVDVSGIDRIALIDSFKEELIEYLDVIDPLKGKIAGIAEQELKYKSAFDPAIYSIGTELSIVDTELSWIDEHVGELWWDLSTAKYQWYEQGDEIFRKNNWGKLFPGSTIDVYEWVKSDLLPSEWAAQADTNQGLTKGISGQPKYPDNSVVSVKQLFNNVTGSAEDIYFFWVKNKVTVPNVKNRRISSYQVSSIILDPVANGLKFIEILSADSLAFANVQPMLVGNRINANIASNSNKNKIPRHTEWVLMAEGNSNQMPAALLEKKLIDSLLGHDFLGNIVPSNLLTYRNRYGIGIRPQQTLFKDRIEALRNQITFVNSVLIKEKITGNYNFNNLNSYDPTPDELSKEYDIVVGDFTEINGINTLQYEQASLTCTINNGKIISVEVSASGYGYKITPLVTIVSSSGKDAIISTEINSRGQVINATISNSGSGYVDIPSLIVRPHTVIVTYDSRYNNRWTMHQFNYNSRNTKRESWTMIKNQKYDTRLYWNYVNWVSENYNSFKDYKYVIEGTYGLSTLEDIVVGDYVKVNNVGDGRYIILEKLANSVIGNFSLHYDVVFSQKGTIQISESLWKFSNKQVAYDVATLEETLYDQIPDIELYRILLALKDDIFVNNLKVYWNKFFFAAVKYAFTEQKLLDWAFKTSFINVTNTVGSLDQRPVYKLDNEKYFEEYVKEVKPYHTNIRNYISKYTSLDENSNLSFTDFDAPSYYNTATNKFEVVTLATTGLINQQPWKLWADNYTYCLGSITVANPGIGYTQLPTVTISGGGTRVTSIATAEAYLRNGGIYQILVTNPGAGYTITPVVTISGGGPNVILTASVSVSLLNFTTRKNIIGLRFDRVSAYPEIGDIDVNDTFICSGKQDKFTLSILADRNKLDISPTLDGKLILSNDYTIQYYRDENEKEYSRFVFLNYIPNKDQIFKISYKKSIELYTAVDRITKLNTSTDSISSFMSGVEYPNNIIQGLPFEYSASWDGIQNNSKYDVSAWSDVVGYYASAKLIRNVQMGTSTLYLSTTTDIYLGQVINILNSTTTRIRQDTVVVGINTTASTITISQPYYVIKTVKSTATNIGSDIVITTAKTFNNGIILGDTVTIAGMDYNQFNGQYTISSILDNDKFIVKARAVLPTTATIITFGDANATISTIPVAINTASVLIGYGSDIYSKSIANTITVELLIPYKEIVRIQIFKDNETVEMPTGIPITGPYPNSEYYFLTVDPVTQNVIANFYQMGRATYTLKYYVYGNTTVEFWKTDINQSNLESTISGGSWSWNNFLGGQGVTFTSTSVISGNIPIVIDGDQFVSERSSYAPEECVNGHVLDSLGINVYTKAEVSYPTVLSGSFPVIAGTYVSATLSIPVTQYAGMIVHYNGKMFSRVDNALDLSSSTQYYMVGNVIHMGLQSVSGRAGYTMITIGGDYSVLDSNLLPVTNVSRATVISLLSNINDVHGTYVLVNGIHIEEITQEQANLGTYGYVVGPYSDINNRASVTVYNLPSLGTNNIQAWFLQSKYTNFNRVNEEIINVGTSQTIFQLDYVPGNIEPASAQVIVEISDSTTGRKRLLPPWVSYYQVVNGQLTFAVDNKHNRSASTYSPNTVSVYANGVKLRPGFDYTLNEANSTVTIIQGLLNNGDAVAVVGLIDYDYNIEGNLLKLITPVSNVDIKVTSFTDHDNMLIKTERFDGSLTRRFTLSFAPLSDDYVWVYVDGISLTARNEFNILDDSRTIEVSDLISVTTASSITITTINPPSFGNYILGYRVFNDMFNRGHFNRLSAFHSTTLLKPLKHTDSEIYLTDGNGIIPPNPLINKPGIVIIDGERIEFSDKDGNVLRQLRRSTLGTGPATFSNIGTQVFDQSAQQTIPYTETTLIQTTSTTATIYVINTLTTTATGAGIVLNPYIDAVNQVTVYYGGRQLRKTSLSVALDKFSNQTIKIFDPEFTINTATNTLRLNISDSNGIDTDITIVQRKGYVWTGTESLLTSSVIQAQFLRKRKSILPDTYYYGASPIITTDDYEILTDNNNNPLEGY